MVRLKKLYGERRWIPEEDAFYIFNYIYLRSEKCRTNQRANLLKNCWLYKTD